MRVLDLTRALAGPFCTMILGDLGADVIKIEPLPDGDFIRTWGPFDHGESTYFLSTSRNKRSLALDFRHPGFGDLVRELAGQCDVVVENFKPGVMQDMGLDYARLAALQPRLIYAAISGYGSGGPAGGLPGFDQIAQAWSGFMSLTGTEQSGPMRSGVAIGDLTAGMWAAIGVLGALRARDLDGRGRQVDSSLLGSLVGLLSVQGQRYLSLGEVPPPAGNDHPVIAPYGVFQAADGAFTLAPATPEMWRRLCEVLGLASLTSDPRFVDNAARMQHREALKALIETELARAPRAQWIERFNAAGIPAGPIHALDEVFQDRQVRESGMIEEIQHPTIGRLALAANPLRMAGLPEGAARRAPPLLGQHSREILRDLGLEAGRVDALLASGLVRQADQRGA